MADGARVICDSSALENAGMGVRFKVQTAAGEAPAFVVRFDGKVYALTAARMYRWKWTGPTARFSTIPSYT
jgi:hypothetical protein